MRDERSIEWANQIREKAGDGPQVMLHFVIAQAQALDGLDLGALVHGNVTTEISRAAAPSVGARLHPSRIAESRSR